jgi:hypothetical protein
MGHTFQYSNMIIIYEQEEKRANYLKIFSQEDLSPAASKMRNKISPGLRKSIVAG